MAQITVTIGLLGTYESFESLKEKIVAAEERAQKEGIFNLRMEVHTGRGYYGDETEVVFYGAREETSEEAQLRKVREQEQEQRRYEHYLQLKKEFEK